MSTVTIKTQIQVDGLQIDPVSERRFTDLALIHDQEHAVQLAEKPIWSANGVGSLTGFTLLVLTSDQPVELELVTEDLLLERQVNSLPLGKDVALVLSADDGLYNYVVPADSFTGSLGKLNLLRVREVNNVLAKLRLRLFR